MTITNMKVHSLQIDPASGQYELNVLEPSIFDPNGGEIRNIRLWSRRDGAIDAQTIETTQNTLRQELDDDQILFTDPTQATTDPNHIQQWVQSHVGHPIKEVTMNGSFYRLGSGGGGIFGDTKFKSLWDKVSPYNPSEHRVSVYDGLSQDLHTQFETLQGPNIRTGRGYTNLEFDAIIEDVMLTRATDYNIQPERKTRAQVKAEVLEALNMDPSVQALTTQIEALPQDFAYTDLIKILGGTYLNNIQGAKPLVKDSIEGIIKRLDRTTARFYLQIPSVGYTFLSSAIKAPASNRSFGMSFEYVTDDFSAQDLNRLLGNVPGLTPNEVAQDLEKGGLFENGQFKYHDAQTALNALRSVFVGRKAAVSSLLKSPKMARAAIDRLGASINSVGPRVGLDTVVTPEAPQAVDLSNLAAHMPTSMAEPTQQPQTQAPVQEPVQEPAPQVAPQAPAQEPAPQAAPQAPAQEPTPQAAPQTAPQTAPQAAPQAPAQEPAAQANPFANSFNNATNPFTQNA